MPPPALKSLAGKAGKSLKDAERYYDDAKKQRLKKTGKKEKDLTNDDYRYIMGVVKKRLGLPTKPVESLAEAMIQVLIFEQDYTDRDVRVFTDPTGEVCFATLDDVSINPDEDDRVALVYNLANNYDWPSTFDYPESIDGYEGSLNNLAREAMMMLDPEHTIIRDEID